MNKLKIMSIIGMIGGVALHILNDYVSDKKLDEKIDERVNAAFSSNENEEES